MEEEVFEVVAETGLCWEDREMERRREAKSEGTERRQWRRTDAVAQMPRRRQSVVESIAGSWTTTTVVDCEGEV